jgi:ectoine hydroxylase-related dioxygenase (phytanoyl-CoA dioxygenase family)
VPPWNLLAAWVALEDIDPRSSVLAYVPGSHRLGYYRFEGGDYRFDAKRHGDAEAQAMADFEQAQCAAAGLEVATFAPPKGGLLVWHHSLLHGGPRAQDSSLTRKSFVVHYTSRDAMASRYGEFVEQVPDRDGNRVPRLRMVETETVLERGEAAGFDNPLKKYRVRPAG